MLSRDSPAILHSKERNISKYSETKFKFMLSATARDLEKKKSPRG